MSNQISQLPIQAKVSTSNMPTVPFPSPMELTVTVAGLVLKRWQIKPALDGLTNTYTIGDKKEATAYEFLFGTSAANPLIGAVDEIPSLVKGNVPDLLRQILESGQGSSTQAPISPRPLDKPEQFSIGWTNYANVYKNAQSQLARWTSTLSNTANATKEFWPTIANYGFGYNLLFLEQVTNAKAEEIYELFGREWARVQTMQAQGRLYAIDLRIFEDFPATSTFPPRFTPGSITLLEYEENTKTLKPVIIRISATDRTVKKAVVYVEQTASSGAWLYATIKSFDISPKRTNFRSPWQNGIAERFVGNCRRDVLDHVIVLNERHLKRLMSEYIRYYHEDRTHLGLEKQTPSCRFVSSASKKHCEVIAIPRLGGLHHRYDMAA